MKSCFFSLFILGFVLPATSQVIGKLIDDNGLPISFATVVLLKDTDSSFVAGTISHEDGSFELTKVTSGKYLAHYSAIGFTTLTSTVVEVQGTDLLKDLGTTVLQFDVKELDEVVIKTQRPLFEQNSSGTIVNVGSSVMSKGSTVLEVLERSPGVVIDHRNNSLTLNGKSGVLIMINGKLMRLPEAQVVGLLNSTNANSIGKIELMNTPPAKYDAEGSAGIINIVMKKNEVKGTNGAFTGSVGYGVGEKASSSINLSHNTSKLNTNVNYSYTHNRAYSRLDILSYQNMPYLGGNLIVTGYDSTQSIQNTHNVSGTLEYQLTKNFLFGGGVSYNQSNTTPHSTSAAQYDILPDSILNYQGNVLSKNQWRNFLYSASAEKRFKGDGKLSINADYLTYHNFNPSTVQSRFVTEDGNQVTANDTLFASNQRGYANTNIKVGVGKLDYSNTIGKKVNVESGVKITQTNESSVAGLQSLVEDTWVERGETTNEIDMRETIAGAYVSTSAQVNSTTRLDVGVRYEYSRTHITDFKTGSTLVDRKLGVIFPNVVYRKTISEKAELQLSWSKRISRPSYNDLAAFVSYNDPSAVTTGNPFLRPAITQNLKVGYTWKDYAFAVLLSRDENSIARYQLTESPRHNTLFVLPVNIRWQNSITLVTTIPVRVNNWWGMSYSFSGGPRSYHLTHTLSPATNTYVGYSVNASQTFTLPAQFTAEISGWYNSQGYNGNTRTGSVGSLNVGIKKQLKGNGGTLQFAVSDVLRSVRYRNYYGSVTREVYDIHNTIVFNPESRMFPVFRLTYSKSFGNSKSGKQRSATSISDEQNRLNK